MQAHRPRTSARCPRTLTRGRACKRCWSSSTSTGACVAPARWCWPSRRCGRARWPGAWCSSSRREPARLACPVTRSPPRIAWMPSTCASSTCSLCSRPARQTRYGKRERSWRASSELSRLAAWAPEGETVVLPLPALADRGAAAPAGQARAAIDSFGPRSKAIARRARHVLAGEADQCQSLLVGYLPSGAPGVHADGEAALRLPQVADAGHSALVQQSVADRARRVVLAQPQQERGLIEALPDHILAQARQAGIGADARIAHQLQQRPIELHHLPAL